MEAMKRRKSMKIRLTIMTENDKHLKDGVSDRDVASKVAFAWNQILAAVTEGTNDSGYIENVEIVER